MVDTSEDIEISKGLKKVSSINFLKMKSACKMILNDIDML